VAIGCELNLVGQPGAKVAHEFHASAVMTVTREP
jgi:hypothetical protein